MLNEGEVKYYEELIESTCEYLCNGLGMSKVDIHKLPNEICECVDPDDIVFQCNGLRIVSGTTTFLGVSFVHEGQLVRVVRPDVYVPDSDDCPPEVTNDSSVGFIEVLNQNDPVCVGVAIARERGINYLS